MTLITPLGFRDILPNEAAERERITGEVQALFASRGYRRVETPTLESVDALSIGGRTPLSPFKFFDSQGDLLAMRPDVTTQIARMAATRMAASSSPNEELKLRYSQRIFRESDSRGIAQAREATQIGIEDIGAAYSGETESPQPSNAAASTAEADAEIVSLCIQALDIAGVPEVVLAMATVGPLRALLERSGATAAWKAAILDAYHDSDLVEIERLCDIDTIPEGCAPAYAAAINKLAFIRGGREAIDDAVTLLAPLGCTDGLDVLTDTLDALEALDVDAELLIDFSIVSSFDYYTGFVFEAYSPNLGSPLGAGGRYDNLIGLYGESRPAAGFAFYLERAMEAASSGYDADRPLRVAVPKGALHEQAVECLQAAGLDVEGLDEPGRQMVISVPGVDYIIVRPSDAPVFVASGAADCGICGRDSLEEKDLSVVELADLHFGGCRFVVARPEGSEQAIADRYRRLGSIRVATKYPRITLRHFAKTGMQVEIVKLNGNIELAPLTGLAECIVDITATGTTLRENDLEVAEEVMDSTARFFANPCAYRTDDRIVRLARELQSSNVGKHYDPIAGKAM